MPQIPALAFSLAILAKFGPLLAVEFDFWTPALALALDHNEPKASPPEGLDAAAAGLGPAAEDEVADVSEETEDMPGRWPRPPAGGWLALVDTEVK